jgi:putative sterol carrier protein
MLSVALKPPVRDNMRVSPLKGAHDMDLAAVTQKVQAALAGATGFDKSVKFDFGSVGKLFIDGAAGQASNEDKDADATVTVSFDDFLKLAQGALDPTMAFMQGKLKVAGDMGVAMKLQSLFANLR